tara:strand:- start:11799 stop:12020 length:222 start_codon:yes stop_codon:yes gene_type:complete
MAVMATGGVRRNGSCRLSSPDLRSFLAEQESPALAVLRFRCGPSGALARLAAAGLPARKAACGRGRNSEGEKP